MCLCICEFLACNVKKFLARLKDVAKFRVFHCQPRLLVIGIRMIGCAQPSHSPNEQHAKVTSLSSDTTGRLIKSLMVIATQMQ